jgi:hypothetical protein
LSWECDRAEAAALDVKPLFAAAYEKAAPTAEDLEDLEGPPKPRERLTSGR